MKKTIKKAFVARPSEWYKLTEGRKATTFVHERPSRVSKIADCSRSNS